MTTRLYSQAFLLYQLLNNESRDATEGKLFEGSMKSLFDSEDNELDIQYYQRARDLLGMMHCIRFVRTGHGRTPSLIHLMLEPSLELYEEHRSVRRKGKTLGYELQESRLRDMAVRLSKLEQDMITLIGIVRSKQWQQPEKIEDDGHSFT